MVTISKNNNVVTLINVFTVKPEDQKKLVDLLIEATQKTMKGVPGFVSANIHRSADGVRVVNYAQWKSRERLRGHDQESRGAGAHETDQRNRHGRLPPLRGGR